MAVTMISSRPTNRKVRGLNEQSARTSTSPSFSNLAEQCEVVPSLVPLVG